MSLRTSSISPTAPTPPLLHRELGAFSNVFEWRAFKSTYSLNANNTTAVYVERTEHSNPLLNALQLVCAVLKKKIIRFVSCENVEDAKWLKLKKKLSKAPFIVYADTETFLNANAYSVRNVKQKLINSIMCTALAITSNATANLICQNCKKLRNMLKRKRIL